MAKSDKAVVFSGETLDRSERFQAAVSHSRLGRQIVSLFTGSSYPGYVQADWRSRDIRSRGPLRGYAEAPGDPAARGWPRRWENAALVGTTAEAMAEAETAFREYYGDDRPLQEAVAYYADKTLHVGTHPDKQPLLREVGDDEPAGVQAVGFRLGPGDLMATVGWYSPNRRVFQSVDRPQVVAARRALGDLAAAGSSILVV